MVNKINNYPFGKNTKSPNFYYTQDVYGKGAGITGRKKRVKKIIVNKQSNDKKGVAQ
jgi:hypothetical protein